jgi:hypothetical protein
VTYRGATLRLAGGSKTISTSSISFPPEFGYGNNEAFLKVFVLSYAKFLCDSPLEPLMPKPAHVITRFLKRLLTTRLDLVIKEFSGYSHKILQGEHHLLANQEYEGGLVSIHPFHEFMLDTPIAREYITWYRTGRPELFKFIISFLTFGKKLEYDDPQFNATALRGWLETEERLSRLEFAERDVVNLTNIIAELLAPIKDDVVLPKFGPGRVAERGVATVWDKIRYLNSHPRLDYTFVRRRRNRGLDEGDCTNLSAIIQGCDSSDVSVLRFVPKDITKSRSICMEPNSFMYFQQEVLRYLVQGMEDGMISRFVCLKDQSKNRDAAIHGSIYMSSDTLDLSSASDSVHIDLVRRTFPVEYLIYMLGTRTYKVQVPESRDPVIVNKFAPMGSAVCFPTQCILFSAISLYAYLAVHTGTTTECNKTYTREEVRSFMLHHLERTRSAETPFTRRFEPPVVYGDDIICDTRVTGEVISTLSRLGFVVNEPKSFMATQSFRESCGVFALDGQDVTPVLFRLPFFKEGEWDAKVYASFLGGINQMRAAGYNAVATFWLSILREYGFQYPLPFTEDDDGFGLTTRNKHSYKGQYLGPGFGPNFCLFRRQSTYENGKIKTLEIWQGSGSKTRTLRWNADWQTYEEVQQGIGPRDTEKEAPWALDSYSKDQWWRSRIRGDTLLDDVLSRSLRIRPQETRLVPTWARCEQ